MRAIRVGESGALVDRLTMPDGHALFVKRGTAETTRGVCDEAERLEWLAGRISAARVVDVAVTSEAAWLVTKALPGKSAGDWLTSDRTLTARVTDAISVFLSRLHALAPDDCPFSSTVDAWLPEARRRVAQGLVDEEDFDADHLGWSASAVLEQVEALAGSASGRVVAHGDFTLGNIILDTDLSVAGCIDVGRLGVADPYQDIAIMWRDLGGFGADAQAAFLHALGIRAPDERRMLLHRSLDELF